MAVSVGGLSPWRRAGPLSAPARSPGPPMTTRPTALESIGAVAESQTRRRISDEKTAPDGTHPGRPGRRTMPRPAAVTTEPAAGRWRSARQHRIPGAAEQRAGWARRWPMPGVHQDRVPAVPCRCPPISAASPRAFGKALAFLFGISRWGRSPARWRSPAPVPGASPVITRPGCSP